MRLIVIPPGRADPYPVDLAPDANPDAIGVAALRALSAEGVRFGIAGMQFARSVATAGIGVVVTYGESGYSVKIEED